ncbi:MAG TPA: hypothetical protein VI756_05520, partial [Blastocatellia bacterium]
TNCTASVNVMGTASGEQNNVSGSVTALFDNGNGGFDSLTGNFASASITVLMPPTITKAFLTPAVQAGGTGTLKFTLTNPNSSFALSGVQFSDSFPAGLVVASAPSVNDGCAGTFSAAAGATSVSLTGGTIAAASSCTITVAVEPTSSGIKSNITGPVSSSNGGVGTKSNPATTFVFDECLKDDTTGDILEWSSTSGAYSFTHCATGFTLSGTGTAAHTGSAETLSVSTSSQKVTANFNTATLTGHAVITVVVSAGVSETFTINQTKTHVTCSCTN